jgi:hypothetical protein
MNVIDTRISETSHRELAAGTLKQATRDLRRFHRATTRVERELYHDAYSWVMSDDCEWPFSFLNVCQVLQHGPNDLREELLGDLSLGTFSQWARRGSRALRTLSNRLTERFATDRNLTVAPPTQLFQTWH